MEKEKQNKEEKNIMTYKAIELSNGKTIAEGNDFLKVDKLAEDYGKPYKINFVPNPKLSFVF